MKSTIQLLFVIILTSIFFSSCEKVVELDLKDSAPKLVIEAGVSDQNTNHIVKISKTSPFTELNQFKGLSGAQVVLTIPGGQKIPFNETAPGIYKSAKFAGMPGNKYVLDVTVDGKIYTATSVMPVRVPLDSLTYKKVSFFGKENIYPIAHYKDPRDVLNQYHYTLKAKYGKIEEILTEDRFTNGNDISETLFSELKDLAAGDSLSVEMQGIDRNVYRYFFALSQISGNGGPPVSPANPASNFNNGALGIFSAYTTTTIKDVVKVK